MEQIMTKQVPRVIRELSRERILQFYKLSKTPTPLNIEEGQIWSTYSRLDLPNLPTSSTEEPRLIVIVTGTGHVSVKLEQITAAPISLMVGFATDFDLIIPETEIPLNYPVMVEIWNEIPVLKAHLRTCLGKLSEKAIAAMRSIHVARLVGEQLPASVKMWVGPELMGENDRRIAFQQSEIEATEYLANVATAAIFIEVTVPNESVVVSAKGTRKLEIRPQFGNIKDFLSFPKRAVAASNVPSGNNIIITSPDNDIPFTFELLERRRESLVYLILHDLPNNLEGKLCTVTLVTTDVQIISEPAEMHKGAEIQIGKVINFDKKNIVRVEIEVE
jgi:hypothetical protein